MLRGAATQSYTVGFFLSCAVMQPCQRPHLQKDGGLQLSPGPILPISVVCCSFNQKVHGCCFLISELLFSKLSSYTVAEGHSVHVMETDFAKLLRGGSSIDGIRIWYLLHFQPKIY